MRFLLPLRSRPALWLLLPALICVVAYARAFVDISGVRGYWLAVGSGSAIFLLFSCALAGVSAAIEGSRERRARQSEIPAARSGTAIVIGRLWPSILLGFLVQLAGFLIMSGGTWGAPGYVPVLVWAMLAAVIFFHAALGYCLGRLLPIAAAIPLALVVSYSWLGFTWSISYFPLRYLSGLVLVDCCSLDTTLDARGPIATIVFSLLAGLLLIVVARVKLRLQRPASILILGASIMGIAASTAVGLVIASGLGAQPVEPRPQAAARCHGSAPRICTYPEQVGSTDPSSTLRKAVSNLERLGVAVPATIRFTSKDSTAGTLNMAARPFMTPQQTLYSFTSAFMPPTVAVYCGNESDYNTRVRTSAVIQTWLLNQASEGLAPVDDTPSLDQDGLDAYTSLERLTPAQQLRWYESNMPALERCDSQPTPVPRR